jgi:hypothetical protein
MPIFRSGQQVTVITRTVTGQDDYGNDVYSEKSRVVSGCVLSPGNTSEDIQGTASVLSDVILHAPLGTAIGPYDAVLLSDGQRYRAAGQPKNWVSPFTGSSSLIEVPLARITGAMEQFPAAKAGG